ncbi:MAG: 3-oxoacyl-ACP synthase [Putridiphycobacter sp.]|nr:3-oxoacyl-ACP synthase [Putridiphycobacter sp.]
MIKEELLEYCFQYVQHKQNALHGAISDTELSLSSESQSTAGDKHDTSRAMMHLEIEKKSLQLSELEKLKRVLNQIQTKSNSNGVSLGTIIETDQGHFFIAINAGKVAINNKSYTIISLASPLAQRFLTSKINDTFTLRGNTFKILAIY